MKKLILSLILALSLTFPAYAGEQAKRVSTSTGNFNGNLSGSDTTVQAALDTLDDAAGSGHANGANCNAGNYPLGVDASGAVESCTDATTEIDSAILTHKNIVDAHHTATVEVNDLETTDPPNVETTEIYIGTGSGTGAWAAISDDATMTNAGVVSVVDMTCTDCINATEIEDIYVLDAGDSMEGDLTIPNNVDIIIASGGEIEVQAGGAVHSTEQVLHVNNDTGATLYACTAVYISGFDIPSNLPEIMIADADDPAKMPAVGIVEYDIAAGADGQVLTGGNHEQMDTTNGESWAVGDALYVNDSGTSADDECVNTLTNVKPSNVGDMLQKIGQVGRVNAAVGEVLISGADRANDVPLLESAYFWVGNASNVATAVQMSSEATMSNAGAVTLADSVTVHDWALGTIASGVGTALTALDGENIQDNTIDDDSIDLADVTCVDLTMSDCGAITSSGTVEGATLTEGGNAVYNASDYPAIVAENGAEEVIGESLGTACSENQILKANATGGLDCAADATGSGGSAIVFDIGDDGGDDSADVSEIATTGDTNAIFSESAADKILIAVGNNWPTADAATLATTLTITDNESTAENNALIFTSGGDLDGGDLGLECDGTAYYTPSTGVITSTGFAGALTGNVTGNCSGLAGTATALATARAIGGVNFDGTAAITPTTIVVADTTDTSSYVGLWESATGSLLPKTDAAVTYNAGTGILTATGFAGPLTGAVTGEASTATALAANGGNCAAGSYPLGVDASGAIEDCTDATTEINTEIGNVLDGTDAFTDFNGVDIINSDNYAAASIDNEHLADNAVDSAEINTNAVKLDALDVSDVSDNIAADIAEGELANSIVVDADIKADSITRASLIDSFITVTKCIIIETPVDADDFLMYHVEVGSQVTAAHCIVEDATNTTLSFEQCDVAGGNCTDITSDIICDVGGQADDGTIDAPDLDVDDWVRVNVVGTPSGTPGHVTGCISFTLDD